MAIPLFDWDDFIELLLIHVAGLEHGNERQACVYRASTISQKWVINLCEMVLLEGNKQTNISILKLVLTHWYLMLPLLEQERIRTAARVRVCNSVKFKTGQNLLPVLKKK